MLALAIGTKFSGVHDLPIEAHYGHLVKKIFPQEERLYEGI